MARVFVDTNVLAYQFDGADPVKQRRAQQVLQGTGHSFVVSTQVLLELFVVLTRKLRPALPHEVAQKAVNALANLPVVSTDAQLVRRAIATAGRHQLSAWEALVVEAAAESGCEAVWTEDLSVGSTLRGVRVVNPLVGG